MVNTFPFLVSKTPILSDPKSGEINEKSILSCTLPPFGLSLAEEILAF
jgi:hypothetical protein